MELILAFIIGIILGIFLCNFIFIIRKTDYILFIDKTDPEIDKYSLNVGDLDKLQKKKYIKLNIKLNIKNVKNIREKNKSFNEAL